MRTIVLCRLTAVILVLLAGAVTVAVVQFPLTPSHAAGPQHAAAPLRQQHQVSRIVADGTPTAPVTATAPAPNAGPVRHAGPVRSVEGISALTPSSAMPPAAGPSTAAFTGSAVRQYVTTHQFETTDGTTPTIAKVLFIPASEASSLMGGESIGRPDTTLVCYVEVHGNLSKAGIVHELGPASTNTQPAHVGRLVFDAQTGNLLILAFQ